MVWGFLDSGSENELNEETLEPNTDPQPHVKERLSNVEGYETSSKTPVTDGGTADKNIDRDGNEIHDGKKVKVDGSGAHERDRSGGVDRRSVLKGLATVAGAGATGTAGAAASDALLGTEIILQDQESTGTEPASTGKDTTETETPEETEQPEDEQETQEETHTLPETGTFNFKAEDGGIGSNGFFDQGHITLETYVQRENGEEEYLTTQQIREKEHFNKIQEIAENNYTGREKQILKEFPHKIMDEEWRQEIYDIVAEEFGVDPSEMPDNFDEEVYDSDSDFETRYEESRMDSLWRQTAIAALGGISSTNDWIKTAAIAGAEYHTAGKTTITFDDKTLSGVHGLGFAITNPTYSDQELEQQKTWGIETDTNEDTPIWNLDETHGYPNDNGRIAFETQEPDADPLRIGLSKWEDADNVEKKGNVYIESHIDGEFEDFIRNPSSQKGMKYLDAMCLASYIEDQAHEDGALPELNDAEIHVYDDRIEYELDGATEITQDSNLYTPDMDTDTETQTATGQA